MSHMNTQISKKETVNYFKIFFTTPSEGIRPSRLNKIMLLQRATNRRKNHSNLRTTEKQQTPIIYHQKDKQKYNIQIFNRHNLTLKFEITVKLNDLVYSSLPLSRTNITDQFLPPPFITT